MMQTSARGVGRVLSMVAAPIAVAAICGSFSCSNGDPPGGTEQGSVSATIGKAGGKIELPGKASIVIPPGAIDGEVKVGISVVKAPSPLPASAVSDVVAITPHGLELGMPADVSIRYEGSPEVGPSVVHAPGADANAWTQVGGVETTGGAALFETMTFSYYAVVDATCTPVGPVACSASCECCGTASCVDTATSPQHCGGCKKACAADAYCDGASKCSSVATSKLCDNARLFIVHGALPADVVVVSQEQTTDGASAAAIAGAIAQRCGLAPATTASQAEMGVLDPCTDAPLQTGGTTDVIAGGTFGQRVARFLERSGLAPYRLQVDEASGAYSFLDRSGAHVVDFARSALNPSHDYFVIALIPEPERGALILHVYGVGWEGTPAAVHYFTQVALPQIVAGTRTWQKNLLVEWTDDGDGVKTNNDTFTILAQDR